MSTKRIAEKSEVANMLMGVAFDSVLKLDNFDNKMDA